MIRNLKALSLALVAVFAMSAVVGSPASAQQGELTSDGPVKLTGKDSGEKISLTGFEMSVTCEGEYTIGLENETPHTFWDPSIIFVAIFTIAPHYNNCEASTGETTLTMNGCDYLIHVVNDGGGGEFGTTADIVCPGSSQIEVHMYSSSSHSLSICTVKVPPQTGATGGVLKTISEGGVHKLTLKGPISGLKVTKSGLCGSGEINNGALDVHAVIGGINKAGEPTGITVTT